MAPFELSTSISNLRHLADSDLSSYDAVYLGNLYCRRYEANVLERPDDLATGLRRLRDAGKRAYLTTYAAPRNDTLPVIRRALEVAARAGAEAVEVHSVGILKLVRDEVPELPVHVGSFANVYTELGVEVLRGFGVRRITPHYELTLDEIDAICRDSGMPLELLIHGKMPLGLSDVCVLLQHETTWGVRCPDLCQQEVFLQKDGWGLKSVGTAILSGRDVCLLEHLPRLMAAGHRHFRIETVSESPVYRREIGAVYREALTRALAGEATIEPGWWATLRAHSRLGFCNGFAFGRSGMDYVGADPPATDGLRARRMSTDGGAAPRDRGGLPRLCAAGTLGAEAATEPREDGQPGDGQGEIDEARGAPAEEGGGEDRTHERGADAGGVDEADGLAGRPLGDARHR